MSRIYRIVLIYLVLISMTIPADAMAASRGARAARPATAEPAPADPAPASPAPGDSAPATDEALMARDRNLGALRTSLDRIARMDTAQWELLEVLLTLNDEEWAMLKHVLTMPPAELNQLVTTIGAAGGVYQQPDTDSPQSPTPGEPVGTTPPTPEALSLNIIYNTIVSKVDAARSRIDGVRGRIDTLLPDQVDVRNLFKDIPIANVIKTLDTVKESFGNLIETLDTLREGYESFDDGAMKHDLMGMLDDLEEAWLIPQELGCFDNPDNPIRELNTQLVRTLIDKLPKVALLAMNKMLDIFAPDWRTNLREVIDGVPMDLREGVCNPPGLFGETLAIGIRDRHTGAALAAQGDASGPECAKLRGKERLGDLQMLRVNLKRGGFIFDSISEYMKDDQTFSLNIVAVGGGGGGTDVKLPAKPTFKLVKNLLDLLTWRIENLLERRDKCLAEDDRIERDLLSCTPLAEYLISLTDARHVALRRVDELADAGMAPSISEQAALEDADNFADLCEAYQDILMN